MVKTMKNALFRLRRKLTPSPKTLGICGLLVGRFVFAAFLGALPAWGVALATEANPWALWLVATWVHLVARRETP